MKVAIYGYIKEEVFEYTQILLTCLADFNIETFIEKRFYDALASETTYPTFKDYSDLDSSYDIMFTLGGDGTFLRAVTFVRDLGIPVLGINMGRLGFLATIQKENISASIKALIDNDFSIKERSLLTVRTSQKNKDIAKINFALNEVTVARRNTTSMITIKTYLDDEYLTSYWADGLIISTPTGSTGYSLSCGGPVITPEAKSFAITPIAPHNLNARPLIITDNTKIKLTTSGREKQALLSLDSRITVIDNDTEVYIEKAPFTIKTIELHDQTFLKTLREKLLWGEDNRN